MQYRTIGNFIVKKIHFKKTFQQKISSILQIYHILLPADPWKQNISSWNMSTDQPRQYK